MTLTLEPESEARLLIAASRRGLSADELLKDLLPPPTARELLQLPAETRDALLQSQAIAAAPLYEEDLLRPENERQLVVPISGDIIEPEVYLDASE